MKSIKITFKKVVVEGQFRIASISYPNGGQNLKENDVVTIMNVLRLSERPIIRTGDNNTFAYDFAADF